jgi:fluoride exporter
LLQILIIGLGGFVGTVARYGVSVLAYKYAGATFPFGTLTVNIVGCFLIGLVYGLIQEKDVLSTTSRLFLTVGVFGGFTTFSSFGNETLLLLRAGHLLLGIGYMLISVLVGVVAVWGGYSLVRGG